MLPDEQIARIAKHAFDNPARPHRFNEEKYGKPMGIQSADDLARAIRAAASDRNSKVIDRAQGGFIIWHPPTNLTVLADDRGGGTAYRDKRFEKDFERLERAENISREKGGRGAARVRDGGVAENASPAKSPRLTPELLARVRRVSALLTRTRSDHERER